MKIRLIKLFLLVFLLVTLVLIGNRLNSFSHPDLTSTFRSNEKTELVVGTATISGRRVHYVKGEVIVSLKRSLAKISEQEEGSLVSAGLSNFEPVIKGRVALKSLRDTYVAKFNQKISPETILKRLEKLAIVKNAELNYLFRIAATPNDTSYGSQWGLNTASDYDIDAPAAWDIQTGSSSVNVAVIDTGVDYDHPDLNANIWVNIADPVNGIDDDGNGLIDDYYGWDWYNNDNNPMDDNGHGTHCAGIVAAETNNATGVAGVAGGWGAEGTNIMSLKAFSSMGWGSTNDIVNAIDYAVDKDADIISMSFVSDVPNSSLETAINDAYTAGLVLVAAAGNDDTAPLPYDGYPAKYGNCIAVTAIGSTGAKASYANYGSWVDIAAPGSSIYSTVWNNTYSYKSGTSMATPHVAGVAALIKSEYPTLTNTQIRQRLLWTTKEISAANPSYASKIGSGLLDADDALGDYNLFPHTNTESFGTSPRLNVTPWKIYQFTCSAGSVTIKVNAKADSNGSSDDDDLKITLDGVTPANCDWNQSKAWDGASLRGGAKTVTITQTLTAGVHRLKFYADETPTINGILIAGEASTVTYPVEEYPNETSSNLNLALWKDTDYAFTTTEAGTVRLEVTGTCDSNGFSDDDDMKMVLVETTGGDDVVVDFGWGGVQGWDGKNLNSRSKTVITEQFLPAGSYKLQIWGDVTPHLHSVIISGATTNGNIFEVYPTEIMPRAQVGLVKEYTFVGTAELSIKINASCDAGNDDDDLKFKLDGATIPNGNWNQSKAWDGATLNGNSKTVTYEPNVSDGLHKLSFYADETPRINWISISGLAGDPGEVLVAYPNVTGNINFNEQILYNQNFTNTDTKVRISIIAQTDSNGSRDDDDVRVVIDNTTSYNWDLKGDYTQGAVREITLERTLTAEQHNLKIYGDRAPTIFSVFVMEDNYDNPILNYFTVDTALNYSVALWKTFTFASSGSVTIEITGKAQDRADDDDLRIKVDNYDYGWNTTTSLNGSSDKGRFKTFSVTRDFGNGTHTLRIDADARPTLTGVSIR